MKPTRESGSREQRPTEGADPEARKPYQAPQIVSRESLEALAAVCNAPNSKNDPVSCPAGPPQS